MHLENLFFFLFFFNFTHQKNIKISPMQYEREDTEVVVSLPENSEGYITSKFRTDEIEEISCREQRLWIGIWNKSLTKNIEIKKKSVLGFFVLETRADIEIKHEKLAKKKQTLSKILKKNTKRRIGMILPMLVEIRSTRREKLLQA